MAAAAVAQAVRFLYPLRAVAVRAWQALAEQVWLAQVAGPLAQMAAGTAHTIPIMQEEPKPI
jgi:hypothetical protein